MFNPFSEKTSDDTSDAVLVEQAQNGSRAALEKLVLRHQAWIYNIAVRMVFHPHDAEEVTQEVLVKVITKLSTFKGESQFRTWLYRIAANHVLNMKRRSAETNVTTFADYGAGIDGITFLAAPLTYGFSSGSSATRSKIWRSSHSLSLQLEGRHLFIGGVARSEEALRRTWAWRNASRPSSCDASITPFVLQGVPPTDKIQDLEIVP